VPLASDSWSQGIKIEARWGEKPHACGILPRFEIEINLQAE
jgi:hypothetical protein